MTRIISGVAGGRRLAVPPGRSTRPTADRTREGLFSALAAILGGDLSGRSFVDLYAGSGAVGLEAASRGAAPVLLIEREVKALRALRRNVATLELPGVQVRADSVERSLTGGPAALGLGAVDVVFVDPPYAEPVDDVLRLLVDAAWLRPGGVVVVERDSRTSPPEWPLGLQADRSRRYGDSTLWYGRRP
jgi:16S rRNA (guanine966-N2)-methyltransferase